MGSGTNYTVVDAPAQACYDWWRTLRRLPEIFDDVLEVTPVAGGDERTKWSVRGPAGRTIEWQAQIVEDKAPSKIAWSTVESADPDVSNEGVVRFDDNGDGTTGVEISVRYDPPGGKIGEAVASLLADPQQKVDQAAAEFKRTIEAR